MATPQMGSSYAGAGATAQDAATAFLNPAGMTRLEEAEFLGGLYAADFALEFDQSNETVAFFGGGNGGNAGGFLPGLGSYLVLPLADEPPFGEDLRFGMAVNGIFGGAAEYGNGWVGRTFVTKVELTILNLQPGLALRLNDWLSVGASLNVFYAELGKMRLRATPAPGAQTLKADGADDWKTSFTAGVLLEPTKDTRIGITYRYKADMNLTGGKAPDFQYDFNLAQGFNVSLFHQLTPRLALLADAGWSDWSDFSQQRIIVGPADVSFSRRWKDTYRVAGGFQYKLFEEGWLLQGGVSYDSSPVKSSRRTPDLPVSEQWRFSAGLQRRIRDHMTVGLSYTFLWFNDPKIRRVDLPGIFPVRLDGEYDPAFGHFVGVTFKWTFCSPLPWASCPTESALSSS